MKKHTLLASENGQKNPEFEFGVFLVLFAMAIVHFGADGPLLYVVYASHAMGSQTSWVYENLYTSINGNPNHKTYKSKP